MSASDQKAVSEPPENPYAPPKSEVSLSSTLTALRLCLRWRMIPVTLCYLLSIVCVLSACSVPPTVVRIAPPGAPAWEFLFVMFCGIVGTIGPGFGLMTAGERFLQGRFRSASVSVASSFGIFGVVIVVLRMTLFIP